MSSDANGGTRMDSSAPTKRSIRHRLFEAMLVSVSLLIGLGIVEIGYRLYLYYTYAVQAEYAIKVMDARMPNVNIGEKGNVLGPYPRGSSYTETAYDKDNQILEKHKVSINN